MRAISVYPREGEDIDSVLKRFKRKLKDDGMIIELRRREYFMKPSEIKKMKRRRKKTIDGEKLNETAKSTK